MALRAAAPLARRALDALPRVAPPLARRRAALGTLPSARYESLVASGKLTRDPHQLAALSTLDRVWRELEGYDVPDVKEEAVALETEASGGSAAQVARSGVCLGMTMKRMIARLRGFARAADPTRVPRRTVHEAPFMKRGCENMF